MRYIEDYSNAELVEMTDDQVAALIDLECARNGAPLLLGEAPKAPESKVFEKDFEYFEFTSFLCDKETMARIMAASESGIFYDRCYSTEVVKETDSSYSIISAAPKKGFSQQRFNEVKVEKSAYDLTKSEHDDKKREHDKAVSEREESIQTVRNKISEAWDHTHKLSAAKTEWARYMSLSEQNENIAMNFMKQRYNVEFIKCVVPDFVWVEEDQSECAA